MAIATMDRCTVGQHESHDVINCSGTRIEECYETMCRDCAGECPVCRVPVCYGCLMEHKHGTCFENNGDRER